MRLKNLASKALSSVIRRIAPDWRERCGCRPVLLETFLDPEKYHGASYRAANWRYLGLNTATGRRDHHKERLLLYTGIVRLFCAGKGGGSMNPPLTLKRHERYPQSTGSEGQDTCYARGGVPLFQRYGATLAQ
ncbi:MAG TPA: hypothetical protein VLH40_00440 [Atribacteraceae bacterium]|nr:hypothetical protein [Atribacteraceae bacterium]